MSRTPVRRAAVAGMAALALGLTACGSSSSEETGAVASPSTTDQLTIAVDKDSGPVNIFAGTSGDAIIELVYDKLFAPSPYAEEIQPWLASEARAIAASTWEVDLRTDVTWQDGEKFTPEDVVFSFNFMHQVPTGRYTHHVNDTPNIEQVVKVDEDTVRF